ncbi:HAD family hydrolase [Cribrihabitans pelagius]|uniref:HAD family hydrolase n=1 Tax=Cribrihabitans pelagius TaxID=1765746 RepID=UPI003B5B843F
MNLKEIKALTYDTGGTVLDWHSGFRDAFAAAGQRHGIRRDWAALANDLRRRSMQAMLNLGENGPPEYNFDEAHHFCLEALLEAEGLEAFDAQDRRAIAWEAPHGFDAWPDVREGLAALRRDRIVASFSLLSYRLIIDSSRRNGLVWDAVLSCEGLGLYKLLPEAYRRAAGRLQLAPEECLMVACHPYDLDAARQVGFRTALVRRPREWGDQPPETPAQGETGAYDLEVDSITELAAALRG